MTPGDRWFFDRVAPVYDVLLPAAPAGPLRNALAQAHGPVRRILDVGGGTGRAAREVPVPERTVVDASPGMLAKVPAEVNRVLASATDLPVADGAVDAVVMVDALHHFPDHTSVHAESYRVLRPGGVLVIRDFDRSTVRGRLLEAAEHAIRMESTFRSATEIRDQITAADFESTVLDRGFACTVLGRKPGGP